MYFIVEEDPKVSSTMYFLVEYVPIPRAILIKFGSESRLAQFPPNEGKVESSMVQLQQCIDCGREWKVRSRRNDPFEVWPVSGLWISLNRQCFL